MYAKVSQLVCSLKVFHLEYCRHVSPPPCVLHIQPISPYFILLPNKSTHYWLHMFKIKAIDSTDIYISSHTMVSSFSCPIFLKRNQFMLHVQKVALYLHSPSEFNAKFTDYMWSGLGNETCCDGQTDTTYYLCVCSTSRKEHRNSFSWSSHSFTRAGCMQRQTSQKTVLNPEHTLSKLPHATGSSLIKYN
jgi:hypothetical protein